MTKEQPLTQREAAALLGVTQRQVRYLTAAGKLERTTLPDGRTGYTRESVEHWAITRRVGRPATTEEE